MAAERTGTRRPSLPPVSDSPWFWLGIFSLMGLAVLFAMGPRYRQRQPQLERQFYARQMGGQSVMGDHGPSTAARGSLLIPLRPLIAVLLGITGVCWTMVLVERLRQQGTADATDPADLPEKVRGP